MLHSFGVVAGIILKPAAALLLIPASVISGVLWGLYRGLVSYIYAFRFNIKPGGCEWKGDREPAKRSYFYGPGFKQYAAAVIEAFESNFAAIHQADDMRDDITFTKSDLHEYFLLPLKVGGLFFVVSAVPTVIVGGTVICFILALLHGAVFALLWLLYSLVLGITLLSEKLFLFNNKVAAQCPSCYKRFRLPAFECSGCSSRFHRELMPGKYGIFRHTCVCGQKLGSTYGTGRYREAAFCPYCLTPLTTALSKPFTVHMVGGTESGKTVYLVSLYHTLKEHIKSLENGTELIIPKGYEERFTELDRWFKGRVRVPNTVDFTAQTYTLMVDHPGLDVKRQLIIYDIAGEAISGTNAAVNMVSLTTCDGLFLMCDPFCSSILCDRVLENGGQLPDRCSDDFSLLVDDLVHFLVDLRVIKTGERCSVPVAVLITKTDIPEAGDVLGEGTIAKAHESSGGEDIADFTDKKCREFLEDIGLGNALRKLDMQFTDVRFFPVSSMGHGYDDTPFAPSGVGEPFYWLLKEKDGKFLKIL